MVSARPGQDETAGQEARISGNAFKNDSGGTDQNGSWGSSWGVLDASGQAELSRQMQFTQNVQNFVTSGDTLGGREAASDDGATASAGGFQTGQQPEGTWTGVLSPLQRLQLNDAAQLKGFIDAGKTQSSQLGQYLGQNAGSTLPGSEAGGLQTSSSNGASGQRGDQNSNGPTPSDGGGPQQATTGAEGNEAGEQPDEQRRREERERWEKLKGLDPETQRMINGPQWPVPGKINEFYGEGILLATQT